MPPTAPLSSRPPCSTTLEAFHAPRTIDEALGCLAGGGAAFLAGGTSLMPARSCVNAGAQPVAPRAFIDLNGVEELSGLARGPRGLTVRPMTRCRALAATSGLHGALQAVGDAAAALGDRQLRNAATIGGGLCWNAVASCMPAVCLCLGATLVLASAAGGTRAVPIDAFLTGPDETVRQDDELLVEIIFPPPKYRGVGSAYRKHGATPDSATPDDATPGGPPVVGVAAAVEIDEAGRCTGARFAVGGLAPTARRFDEIDDLLRGRPGGRAVFAETAAAAADAIEAQSDAAASGERRKALIRTLGRDALAAACARAAKR